MYSLRDVGNVLHLTCHEATLRRYASFDSSVAREGIPSSSSSLVAAVGQTERQCRRSEEIRGVGAHERNTPTEGGTWSLMWV